MLGFLFATAALFEAARGSRPAGGHFHLLAQMKVTKAKGLNTYLAWAFGKKPRTRPVRLKRSLATDAMLPRNSVRQVAPAALRGLQPRQRAGWVLSPFALATFIWGRK